MLELVAVEEEEEEGDDETPLEWYKRTVRIPISPEGELTAAVMFLCTIRDISVDEKSLNPPSRRTT